MSCKPFKQRVEPEMVGSEECRRCVELIDQADELVVLVDSSKFRQRSSLILCGLKRISTVITDEGLENRDARMLEDAGVALIVAKSNSKPEESSLQA